MARKKTLTRTVGGSYVRNLGWKPTATSYAQHKFHLGRDETKATLANLRLEQLWTEVSRRWERNGGGVLERGLIGQVFVMVPDPNPPTRTMSELTLGAPFSDLVAVEVSSERPATPRPVWDATTLQIAEAVRKGEAVAKVRLPSSLAALPPDNPAVGDWLDQLQLDITVIKIELEDPAIDQAANDSIRKEGLRLVEMGRQKLHRNSGGDTLNAALTAYGQWIEGKYLDANRQVTAWGQTQGRQVEFLKAVLPNTPLSSLDIRGIDDLLEVLRLRPAGKGGSTVSVSWTRNVIKQFRHFLRWLSRSDEFAWKRPADLEFGQVRIPLHAGERGRVARPTQVDVYTVDELRTLWEYATPFERVLMLLALNCGFGRAEVASLEMSEVLLRQRHPREREVGYAGTDAGGWVMRVRHKSGVYGEWKLWTETVRAVEWYMTHHRPSVAPSPAVGTLLVTDHGGRYDAPTKGSHANSQLSNAWVRLTERVRKDLPQFRRLSFNKLRKTAGNLVREAAGGEVAGVFLSHGNPVKSDSQLDVYTNRPFAKVFAALDKVGSDLRPLWQPVTEPFPAGPAKAGGPNISLGTIRRIRELRNQGMKLADIAAEVGVSRGTVSRWADLTSES